jgi:CheY-like chemotaxis protein
MPGPEQLAERRSPRRFALVVDDDYAVLGSVSGALQDHGYEVTAALDGREALALLEHGRIPDIVLLDLMMPIVDGWSVLRAMGDRPELRSIPVLVITASGRPVPQSPARTVRVMQKPFALDRLLAEVERCIGAPQT